LTHQQSLTFHFWYAILEWLVSTNEIAANLIKEIEFYAFIQNNKKA